MVRRRAAFLVLSASLLAVAACGGSSTDEGTSTSTVGPTTAVPTTSPSVSILPVPPTSSATPFAAACSALTTALKVEDLQPRNTGDWTAERQRIIADTASNAALYDRAASTGPADLVAPLGTLATYARFIGTAVSSTVTFDAAVTAVGAYPDKVGASLATATVDSWRRTNCR